jgi:flagellar basal-body rod protein FlgB
VSPDISVSDEPGRANGNNVNIGREMVALTETALTQELLIRAMNDKFGLVRTAVGNT